MLKHQTIAEILPYFLFGGVAAEFDWLLQTNKSEI